MQDQSTDHGRRLIGLWSGWLMALLFHVNLGLMPLFHGISPAIESLVAPGLLPTIYWGMLCFFLLPIGALVLTSYAPAIPERRGFWRRWLLLHFILSVMYSAANLIHLLADILLPDSRSDQVGLMVVMVAIGLLINRETWLWWRQGRFERGLFSRNLGRV